MYKCISKIDIYSNLLSFKAKNLQLFSNFLQVSFQFYLNFIVELFKKNQVLKTKDVHVEV